MKVPGEQQAYVPLLPVKKLSATIAFSSHTCPHSAWLKAVAPLNILLKLVTLETSQEETGWLNALASLNTVKEL